MSSRPDQGAPGSRPRPNSRKAAPSSLRRATRAVLGLGTVLALVSACGPLWVVRVGLVVAVAAGVLACALAWRELHATRRQHAGAMLSASQQHGATLREERQRNAAVVTTLTERVQSAGMVIAGQRAGIARLRTEVAGLTGQTVLLREQVAQSDGVVAALRETLTGTEAELAALRSAAPPAQDGAELHHMPRRVLGNPDTAQGDGATTVVDLRTLETAMVLPNYEDDRRVG